MASPNVTELRSNVAIVDELNDCLEDAITIADLLSGVNSDSVLADDTLSNAGNIIANRLRHAKSLGKQLWTLRRA